MQVNVTTCTHMPHTHRQTDTETQTTTTTTNMMYVLQHRPLKISVAMEERGCQGSSARLLLELGTESGAGIPGVQEEWKGNPGRERHVPRDIKVSELGESSAAGGERKAGQE